MYISSELFTAEEEYNTQIVSDVVRNVNIIFKSVDRLLTSLQSYDVCPHRK